jgi:diadenosine tetraphosphate (Ap4A) HIT family hydrolase
MASGGCGVCDLHADDAKQHGYEISRGPLWILRHHPDPSPLEGWLFLDARRHLGGPIDFQPEEAAAWGPEVQRASQLVKQLTGCDRVYALAFGEGARHLHMHLIPRFASEPASEAWKVADLYRAMVAGQRPAAPAEAVQAFVQRARQLCQ